MPSELLRRFLQVLLLETTQEGLLDLLRLLAVVVVQQLVQEAATQQGLHVADSRQRESQRLHQYCQARRNKGYLLQKANVCPLLWFLLVPLAARAARGPAVAQDQVVGAALAAEVPPHMILQIQTLLSSLVLLFVAFVQDHVLLSMNATHCEEPAVVD